MAEQICRWLCGCNLWLLSLGELGRCKPEVLQLWPTPACSVFHVITEQDRATQRCGAANRVWYLLGLLAAWCCLLGPRSVIALRCALDQLRGDGGLDNLELGSCSSCVVVAVSNHSLHSCLCTYRYTHTSHMGMCV